MNFWIETARILTSILFLSYSSWQDIKKREVSNTVWLIFLPTGLFLSLLEVLLGTDLFFLIPLALSVIITTGLSFGLFYLGLFGGADAKALICLSTVMPIQPSMLKPYLGAIIPVFPLSVLINAVFASSMLALGIIFYNFSRYLRTGKKLFRGLENEPTYKKVLLFITGIKVHPSKIKDSLYYIPLETVLEENGKIVHHLRLFPRIADDEAEKLTSLNYLLEKTDEEVWATPSIPFLLFVTIGFFTTLFIGDVLFWFIFRLFDALIVK